MRRRGLCRLLGLWLQQQCGRPFPSAAVRAGNRESSIRYCGALELFGQARLSVHAAPLQLGAEQGAHSEAPSPSPGSRSACPALRYKTAHSGHMEHIVCTLQGVVFAKVKGRPALGSRSTATTAGGPPRVRRRDASAWRLALRGLAVAPAGLGGLAGGLLPRLRAARGPRLANGVAMRLGIPAGGALQGGLFPSLRSHGDGRLQNSLPPPLRSLGRSALARRLAPGLWAPRRLGLPDGLAALPPGLVRVRHHHLLPGQPLRLSPSSTFASHGRRASASTASSRSPRARSRTRSARSRSSISRSRRVSARSSAASRSAPSARARSSVSSARSSASCAPCSPASASRSGRSGGCSGSSFGGT